MRTITIIKHIAAVVVFVGSFDFRLSHQALYHSLVLVGFVVSLSLDATLAISATFSGPEKQGIRIKMESETEGWIVKAEGRGEG